MPAWLPPKLLWPPPMAAWPPLKPPWLPPDACPPPGWAHTGTKEIIRRNAAKVRKRRIPTLYAAFLRPKLLKSSLLFLALLRRGFLGLRFVSGFRGGFTRGLVRFRLGLLGNLCLGGLCL